MRLAFALLTCFAAAGCGGSKGDGGPPLVPTTGRAVSGGKPAAGAVLVFHPVGGTATCELPPRARAGPDGRFAVTAADGRPGLPAGEYAVTAEWRSGSGENGEDGRNLVNDRFARPTTTPLKATARPDPDGTCTLPDFTLTP